MTVEGKKMEEGRLRKIGEGKNDFFQKKRSKTPEKMLG